MVELKANGIRYLVQLGTVVKYDADQLTYQIEKRPPNIATCDNDLYESIDSKKPVVLVIQERQNEPKKHREIIQMWNENLTGAQFGSINGFITDLIGKMEHNNENQQMIKK